MRYGHVTNFKDAALVFCLFLTGGNLASLAIYSTESESSFWYGYNWTFVLAVLAVPFSASIFGRPKSK